MLHVRCYVITDTALSLYCDFVECFVFSPSIVHLFNCLLFLFYSPVYSVSVPTKHHFLSPICMHTFHVMSCYVIHYGPPSVLRCATVFSCCTVCFVLSFGLSVCFRFHVVCVSLSSPVLCVFVLGM